MREWIIGLATKNLKNRLQFIFEKKRIIDELEASLTGAPIYAKSTEV